MANLGKRFPVAIGALAFAALLFVPMVQAETVEELKERLNELEQTMNQQIKALKQLIQQKEVERQATQEEEMKAMEEKRPPEPTVVVGYDRGFFLRSADDNFGLRVGGWIQPRYEFTRRDDDEDLSSFFIRRARIDVTGHVFTKRLTFRIMPDLSRTATLRDAWINYAFDPALQVRFGQFTVPFQWHRFVGPRRQHFAERGEPSETFGFPDGRDIGLSLHGQNEQRTLAYGVGFFDGAGRNVQFSNSRGNMISGRVTWAVLGTVPREESDLAYSHDLQWSVGGGVQAANLNEARAWDLGRSPVGNKRADFITGTVDTRLAWQGWSLAGEGYLRGVDPNDPVVSSYTGWAYLLTTGYCIVPEKYEVVARFSQLHLDKEASATRETEWGVGFNIYHRGHDWKTRLNYLRTDRRSGADSSMFLVEHHVQF